MSQLNYYGYLITVFQQTDGSYSYFVSSEFLKSKHQIDGFPSEDNAFDDACCRIDAITDSL